MLRQSAVQVFSSKFNNASMSDEPVWFQPPWVTKEIPQQQRSEFVQKNRAWYLQHQPEWVDQYLRQNQSSSTRMFQMNRGSLDQSLSRQTMQQVKQFPMQQARRSSISTNSTNISTLDKESPKYILSQAKEYLITKQRETSGQKSTWNSIFFDNHLKKLSLIAFIYLTIFILCGWIIGYMLGDVSIKFAIILILFLAIQLCGNNILQKQKSLELNLSIIIISIIIQQQLFICLIEMSGRRMTQLQYYILTSYSVWQTLNNIIKTVQINPPQVNKMFQFNQSYQKVIMYSLRKSMNLQSLKKIWIKSTLISLIFGTLTFFILSLNKTKNHESLQQTQWIVIVVFIFQTMIIVIDSVIIKLRKYHTITTLHRSHQLIPLYMFPFITQDKSLEIESLKFVYNEIEQSKKLFFTEKSMFKNQGNKDSELKEFIIAYMHEKLGEQVDGIIAMINLKEKCHTDLARLDQVSIFKDLTSLWDKKSLYREIESILIKIEREIKFFNFFSEVYFRLLNTNACELGEADLQQEINHTITRYIQFLQASKHLNNIKQYYKLRKVMCYQGLSLVQKIRNESKGLVFQELLWLNRI